MLRVLEALWVSRLIFWVLLIGAVAGTCAGATSLVYHNWCLPFMAIEPGNPGIGAGGSATEFFESTVHWGTDDSRLVFSISQFDLRTHGVPSTTIYDLPKNEQFRRYQLPAIDTVRVSPDASKLAFIEYSKPRCGLFRTTGIYASDLYDVDKSKIFGPKVKVDGRTITYAGGLAWTADGEHLSFIGDRGDGFDSTKSTPLSLYLASVKDSSVTKLFDFPSVFDLPPHYEDTELTIKATAWSNGGRKIAFLGKNSGCVKLYTANEDGSQMNEIADSNACSSQVRDGRSGDVYWAADDSEILFSVFDLIHRQGGFLSGTIYVANSDGSGHRIVGGGAYSAFSPDGSRIVSMDPYGRDGMLHSMKRDGSEVRILARKANGGALVPVAADEWRKPVKTGSCSAGEAVPQPDRNARLVEDCRTLLAMRDRLSGSARLNWDADTPITEWSGVSVTVDRRALGAESSSSLYSHVSGLQLAGRDLKGVFPPEIANLTMLRELDLSGNWLPGTIPPDIARLTSLEILSLSENRLTGSIPPQLGNLVNLTDLDLSGNNLTGRVPPELGGLVNLTELDLSGNFLSGPIPPEFGALLKLTLLSLRFNDLSGPIPEELRNLSALQSLFIEGNENLTGCIPPELPTIRSRTSFAKVLPGCDE